MIIFNNLIANYLGQVWRMVMAFAFIPFYIRTLGIESYGLIGIFAVLQAWLALLDAGIKPTVSREMARFIGGSHDPQSIRDLLRSAEVITITIAFFVGLSIYVGSAWLAENWVNSENLTKEHIASAFSLMGLITAMSFIESLYGSCLAGLQRQVLQNIILIIFSTAKGFGAVALLYWYSPTLQVFFLWQAACVFTSLLVLYYATYRSILYNFWSILRTLESMSSV